MEPRLSIITSCYKGWDYLEGFFQNLAKQTIFDQCELIFIHNDPAPQESAIVNQFISQYPGCIQYVPVQRESLGASWNRAWKAARGEYLAIWNIDDRRAPDSLARQVAALDNHPDCVLSYGDYIVIADPSQREGKLIKTPLFERRGFLRRYLIGGAFLVWRNDIAPAAGLFDEQFAIAADYEFVARLALKGSALIHIDGVLGFFTDAKKGLSTQRWNKTILEETAVQLRYAVYDRVKIEFLSGARKNNIEHILNHGDWIPVETFIPGYQSYCRSKKYLWVLGAVKNPLRFLMMKTGLWKKYLKYRWDV